MMEFLKVDLWIWLEVLFGLGGYEPPPSADGPEFIGREGISIEMGLDISRD